jgi:hypothetical protein
MEASPELLTAFIYIPNDPEVAQRPWAPSLEGQMRPLHPPCPVPTARGTVMGIDNTKPGLSAGWING